MGRAPPLQWPSPRHSPSLQAQPAELSPWAPCPCHIPCIHNPEVPRQRQTASHQWHCAVRSTISVNSEKVVSQSTVAAGWLPRRRHSGAHCLSQPAAISAARARASVTEPGALALPFSCAWFAVGFWPYHPISAGSLQRPRNMPVRCLFGRESHRGRGAGLDRACSPLFVGSGIPKGGMRIKKEKLNDEGMRTEYERS